jgi:hypothetical protein
MKQLEVNFVEVDKAGSGLDDAGLFDSATRQPVDNLLWSDTGYRPDVSFLMAYTEDCILIKYTVTEDEMKADYHHINDPVYRDSCVEFFVSFNNEPAYYNLEFNAMGTVLAAFGSSRDSRDWIAPAVLQQIETSASQHDLNGQVRWELAIKIPFSVFTFHNISLLKGIPCKGNFYKCGDDLPQPHFLSWNPIDLPSPDFHQPRFFGEIAFV